MQKLPPLPAIPHLHDCRKLLRRYDWERYLLSLHLPSPLRELQWVLGAFNVEVARTAEAVSEPTIGAIRLKWWLEALEAIEAGKPPRRHPVAESLNAVVRYGRLPLLPLRELISARELDMDAGVILPDIAALDAYATRSGAGVWLPLVALAEEKDRQQVTDFLTRLGHLWAATGLLRATGHHLRQGKSYIPQEVLRVHGIEFDDFAVWPQREKLLHVLEALLARLRPAMEVLQADAKALPAGFSGFHKGHRMLHYYHRRLRSDLAVALETKNFSNRLLLQLNLMFPV